MNLLRGLEFLFILVVMLLTVTQVILPLWNGLPILPMLGSRKQAEDRVAQVREKKIVEEILKETKL